MRPFSIVLLAVAALAGVTAVFVAKRVIQNRADAAEAAAHIATAPPRDVPSRSNVESPNLSANCRARSAVPRIE